LAAARISVSMRRTSSSTFFVSSSSSRASRASRSETYIVVPSATVRSWSFRSRMPLTIVVGSIPCSTL